MNFKHSAVCSQRREEFVFALVLVLVAVLFGILVPFASYVCATMLHTFDVEMPKVTGALIQMTPWLPATIVITTICMLVWSKSLVQFRSTFRLHMALLVATILVGGFWTTALCVPVWSLMEALPK